MVTEEVWVTCPYCGSDQVEGSHVEIDGVEAYQKMSCLACDHDWTDVYLASHRFLQTGVKLTYNDWRKA